MEHASRETDAGAYARAYFVITKTDDRFVTWRRTAGSVLASLVGRFPTIDSAKAAVAVEWRDAASPDLEAWGFSARP